MILIEQNSRDFSMVKGGYMSLLGWSNQSLNFYCLSCIWTESFVAKNLKFIIVNLLNLFEWVNFNYNEF